MESGNFEYKQPNQPEEIKPTTESQPSSRSPERIAMRKILIRRGIAALVATVALGSPFANKVSAAKDANIEIEFQDDREIPESDDQQVIQFETQQEDQKVQDDNGPNIEIIHQSQDENSEEIASEIEDEPTNIITPVAATSENGGTQYIVPTGSTPTTDPHLVEKKAEKRVEKKAEQQSKAVAVDTPVNLTPLSDANALTNNFETMATMAAANAEEAAKNMAAQQLAGASINSSVNTSPSITNGVDAAMRTAFAEGAYVSEEAARKIADVIINRAVNKGTSVGAEVAAKGQFEAYINGNKGKGNWGWNNYGSGPQNGSIGTERVQQIFMEELNKATSGQSLAYNYTGFRAKGDGVNNVYH